MNSAVNAAHNLGYQEIQSTKPQTLGQGLSDSPVALASWIIEKWYGWSDHDGDVEKTFTKDELLTNVMIYWVTNSGASSARIYYESRHMLGGALPASPFVQPERPRDRSDRLRGLSVAIRSTSHPREHEH